MTEERPKLPLWHICLIAFVAMTAQDLLATAMVVAEAHFNWKAAGVLDSAQWLAMLASSGAAIVSIGKEGWRSPKSLALIASVTVANFVGTGLGVTLAGSFVHH